MQAASLQVDLVHAARGSVTRVTVRRQGYGPLVTITKTVTKGDQVTFRQEFDVPADAQLVRRMALLGLLAHKLDDRPDATRHVACALSVDGKMYAWSTGQLAGGWRQALTDSVLGTGSAQFPSCHEYLGCLFTSM